MRQQTASDARKNHSRRDGADGETGRVILAPEEARQGRIVLTTRTRKIVFLGGLTVLVLIGIAVSLWAWWIA